MSLNQFSRQYPRISWSKSKAWDHCRLTPVRSFGSNMEVRNHDWRRDHDSEHWRYIAVRITWIGDKTWPDEPMPPGYYLSEWTDYKGEQCRGWVAEGWLEL